MASDRYFKLWTKAFGLSEESLSSAGFSAVTDGYYVERHQDNYVFFYYDEIFKKNILACSEINLAKLKTVLDSSFQTLNMESVRQAAWFRDAELAFCDIDFCLEKNDSFKAVTTIPYDIRSLAEHQQQELEKFYLDCSEDDKDTLDLTFENEVALGLYQNGILSGIARYTQVRDTAIADITVLVREGARGQGLSTPLVSRLVELILKEELFPKYRVAENNLSSIAIAKRLGFEPRFRILTWKTLAKFET